MLQGKAKEEFEKWLKKQPFVYFNKYTKSIIIHNRDWFQLNERFINTLIMDFFDSIGIYIEVGGANYRGVEFWYNIQELNTINGHNGEYFKTRTEATTKAIEKASEIFNQLNK